LIRIFRYPPQPTGFGVGEHTDYGFLTLLAQDQHGGLEVRTATGWLSVPPVPGATVVNIGDMLDRLTGGLWRSTPHRVVNNSAGERLSWPLFFDPAFDAAVEPLPGFMPREAGQRWDGASVHAPIGTYGDCLIGKVGKVFPELAAPVRWVRYWREICASERGSSDRHQKTSTLSSANNITRLMAPRPP
jgi:isopenicillin N synthase-like dioxygenase